MYTEYTQRQNISITVQEKVIQHERSNVQKC